MKRLDGGVVASIALGMVLGVLLCVSAATAQGGPEPKQTDPSNSQNTIPEKVAPPSDPTVPNTATGKDLSTELSRSNGVIAPKRDVDPGASVPAPEPRSEHNSGYSASRKQRKSPYVQPK